MVVIFCMNPVPLKNDQNQNCCCQLQFFFLQKCQIPFLTQNQKAIKINKWGWGVHIFLFKIFPQHSSIFLSEYTGAFSMICRSRGETFIFAKRDVDMVALFLLYFSIKPLPGVRNLRNETLMLLRVVGRQSDCW